jgi:hypothetical protein
MTNLNIFTLLDSQHAEEAQFVVSDLRGVILLTKAVKPGLSEGILLDALLAYCLFQIGHSEREKNH